MVGVLARTLGFLSVDLGEGGLLSQVFLAADGLLTLYPSASRSALLECGGQRGPFPQPPSVHTGQLCSKCHFCPLSHPHSPVL